MPASMQVIYPVSDDSSFDHDYYATAHMKIVGEHLGAFIDRTLVTKGLAGGPDTPPPYHAIATIVFRDDEAMGEAMKHMQPVLADLPNFTNVRPNVLIGEVIG